MKFETIAIHGGYTPEPTTKSVAVPIYQTTSYSFLMIRSMVRIYLISKLQEIYIPE